MAASPSDLRAAHVRGLLLPVIESLDYAGMSLATRQCENGELTDWECFGVLLCVAMRRIVVAAVEDGGDDGRWNLRSILRVADDAVFAVRWAPDEWWPYVARTRIGRDTLGFVREVEDDVALGTNVGLDIYEGFIEALRAGEGLMEAWELDQMVPACVGEAVRASI